jgi:chromosome segregation ATPase
MNFNKEQDLLSEIAAIKRQLAATQRELQRYKDRLDELGEELENDDEDDDDEETLDARDTVHLATKLLSLPASELGVLERQHCELWLDSDFEPTVGQVEYLETIYQACEREANLAGREW